MKLPFTQHRLFPRFARAAAIGVASMACENAYSGSLEFTVSSAGNYEYGHQVILPPGFGEGEFTFELWLKPNHLMPVGSTSDNGLGQLINWDDADDQPYSSGSWWWRGNFLLDGHNNSSFENGTFSLQFYGGGRVRWSFGDGVYAGPGGHWSVQAYPASTTPSLLDGEWHHVACVRRWDSGSGAILELWIDGTLIATEETPARTNMATYWSNWNTFPSGQQGWFFGVEKQAAIGILPQYEDYKGLVDDMRFWSRAKSAAELASNWNHAITGPEPGLAGLFEFHEVGNTATCDALNFGECIGLIEFDDQNWDTENAPTVVIPHSDVVYLDFAAANNGIGTQESPFNTLAGALAAANSGALILIAPSASGETATISKQVTLASSSTQVAGDVRIGAQSVGVAVQSSSGFIARPTP